MLTHNFYTFLLSLCCPGIEIIKTPVWLLHGDQDTTVPPRVSIELMHKLQCSVELKIVEGGDHRLATPENIKLIIEAVESIRQFYEDDQKSSSQATAGGYDDD